MQYILFKIKIYTFAPSIKFKSNQKKLEIMNYKLILFCLFGTLFSMQAQNSVKPTLPGKSGKHFR